MMTYPHTIWSGNMQTVFSPKPIIYVFSFNLMPKHASRCFNQKVSKQFQCKFMCPLGRLTSTTTLASPFAHLLQSTCSCALWPKRDGALRRMLCHVWVLVVQKGLWTWEKLLNREASGRFSRAMSKASWNLSQSTAAQRHSEHATTCRLIDRVSLGFPAEPGSLATWAQKSGNILAPWRA